MFKSKVIFVQVVIFVPEAGKKGHVNSDQAIRRECGVSVLCSDPSRDPCDSIFGTNILGKVWSRLFSPSHATDQLGCARRTNMIF